MAADEDSYLINKLLVTIYYFAHNLILQAEFSGGVLMCNKAVSVRKVLTILLLENL